LVAIPPLTARVTDLTSTLNGEQKAMLEQQLADLEARKGAQLVVLILPSTQPETIEQFGIRLFEAWKVGRKGVDDGVMLIVAKDDRRLRIEVGYGLEGALNDATAKRIISETITPQGILAICKIPREDLSVIPLNGSRKFIYLSEVQDPGNAGTILRSADAFGMDAVITSPGSVDMYSPKVVRSTAGSLWHIPVFESVAIEDLLARGISAFSLGATGTKVLSSFVTTGDTVAIFGNEARGLSTTQNFAQIEVVSIPMPGNAESLNLSAAASIVMYHLSNMPR
jgi:tRNA(Leu) C34 or U34 (ribose-2'-O)-methylase TrmL